MKELEPEQPAQPGRKYEKSLSLAPLSFADAVRKIVSVR